MDALPIPELNTFAHASQPKNKMHACGHDGHTAMLLGAAKYLSQHRHFDGTVVFIFQPAEEGGGGAKAMIGDGLFTRFPVDAVFALHNWPGMPAGEFGARVGATQASSNEFEIRIKGVGAHRGDSARWHRSGLHGDADRHGPAEHHDPQQAPDRCRRAVRHADPRRPRDQRDSR